VQCRRSLSAISSGINGCAVRSDLLERFSHGMVQSKAIDFHASLERRCIAGSTLVGAGTSREASAHSRGCPGA